MLEIRAWWCSSGNWAGGYVDSVQMRSLQEHRRNVDDRSRDGISHVGFRATVVTMATAINVHP